MLQTLPVDTLTWPRRAAIIGAGTMGLGVRVLDCRWGSGDTH